MEFECKIPRNLSANFRGSAVPTVPAVPCPWKCHARGQLCNRSCHKGNCDCRNLLSREEQEEAANRERMKEQCGWDSDEEEEVACMEGLPFPCGTGRGGTGRGGKGRGAGSGDRGGRLGGRRGRVVGEG